jgi:hypothetical protein
MLARFYIIAGSLLLVGYGVYAWEGWEFGDPVRVSTAPAVGAQLRPTGRTYTSSSGSGSRSGWIILGGK